MKNQNSKFRAILFAFTLIFAAVAPKALGVLPAPDGGYPGGNTAEGQQALFSLTTGTYNTAVGFLSLRTDTAANFNTAVGAGTLLANTADRNTATSAAALLSNTTGTDNTANGAFALLNNTQGYANTATGGGVLYSNLNGIKNTATGANVLFRNINGSYNTAVGVDALSNSTTGNVNTAMGDRVLLANTEGNTNTAIGGLALASNTTGNANTAIGVDALSGSTTGSHNTALGFSAGENVTTADNVICIGYNVFGENVSDSCYIGNIFGVTSSGGAGVFVNSAGKLGTATSSRRFKEDIKPMERASEALYSLKPVGFRYNKQIDSAGRPQFGLVAEDVEKVNPDLVVCDKDGKPYTVRYDQVNAMLLNEFLKEHRTVQEQQREIDTLKRELKEQRALIEKVTMHTGLSKLPPRLTGHGRPWPRTARNDQ